MASERILIVDDDLKFTRLLGAYLRGFGYAVDAVHDGERGLAAARDGGYAAVILDVMLPKKTGLDVLRELRKDTTVPVLMLTALGDEPDRVAGLELGADEYVPKTFSTRELLARLRAVLRRAATTAALKHPLDTAPITVGAIAVDPGRHRATLNSRLLDLTALEFEMLSALARAHPRVMSREQLLGQVSEREMDVFDRTIDVRVATLRRKLGDDARSPKLIETVRGVGYRLLAPESIPDRVP